MKLPHRRRFLHLAAGTVALPAVSRFAQAQTYPSWPIRLIIPFPPGGSFDAIARPLADKMKMVLGTVVVENHGGVDGALAAAIVARAQPDGYTLLLGGVSALGLYAITANHPLYDPVKDLQLVSVVAVTSYAIVVHPSVPALNLRELVDYAKANPGKLSYGTTGVGSLNQLIGELFKSVSGNLDIVHVPYKGAGPATNDLIAGQIPMLIAAVNSQILALHNSSKLRVLATTSPERLVSAPEIPTAIESGVPDLVSQNYICLVAPAGTPDIITSKIYEATLATINDDKLQKQFIASGFEPARDPSPERAQQWVRDQIKKWTPVAQAIGLNQ